MPLPTRSSSQAHELDDSHLKSLWVGNLSVGVTDSDLMSLFSKYGSVDSVTSYPSRNYAFVYYKRIEDAKAARQALQGAVLRGSSIKIDFSKPAKPCKSLWVSGISLSITKETLEEEFLKFGKIEEFKFIRDRNTAYVDYFRLEDAIEALKSINGKQIGGDQLRVDFLRSHMSRREPLTNHCDAREGQFPGRSIGLPDSQWMLQGAIRNYSEPTHLGLKQQHSQSSGGRRGDGQPSNVLWVGYPPSVHIDEQMLHNAMILFGEIERISSSPSGHYALVDFRSIDEARRAKEGLQGRLFNDPRISIMYASSELASSSNHPGLHLGIKGPRPDVFFTELPFQPSAHMDLLNRNRPLAPNSLSGPAPSSGIVGPNMPMRPFVPRSSFEPLVSGPEFNDLKPLHKFPDTNPGSLMGGPNWRRSSPAPGRLSSPSLGVKQPIRPVSGAWDIFDANQLQRESKRSRIDTVLPVHDSTFPSKKINDQSLVLDQRYGLGQQADECASGPLVSIQDKKCFSPAEVRIKNSGTVRGYLDHDYMWRGVIAKGGTPVCRARCVPIGKGIESDIPDVVNCSARTGLDMLTKHYADAIGFDIIFFLPDSEEDFASYTEFLHYLGAKNRAGVAKFEDGTTLFLVPPSDFLSKVLNVAGPERLYGVVLKFPQHAAISSSMQPESFQSHNMDIQQVPSQNEQCVVSQKEEKVLQTEYSRVVREDVLPSAKQLVPSNTGALPIEPTPSVNTAAVSVAGVTLTPELIATLASLLPGAAKPSGSETAQPILGSSSLRPSFPPSNELDRELPPQGWTHNDQGPMLAGQPFHQVDNQFNPQRQLAQIQTCATSSNTSSNSPLRVIGNSQVQDPVFNLPQQGAVSSRPSNTVGIPSESVQLAVPAQLDRQHEFEVPQSTQKGFGMAHGIDSHASYGSSIYQHTGNSASLSNLGYGTNGNQPHTGLLVDADKGNSELPNQVQQLQPPLYGGSLGSLDVEADKNQRYQSTLQFAASLLFQMQQQKQQPSTKAGQGGC